GWYPLRRPGCSAFRGCWVPRPYPRRWDFHRGRAKRKRANAMPIAAAPICGRPAAKLGRFNLLLFPSRRFAMTEHPSLGPTRRHRPLRAASLECLRAPWIPPGDEMSARPRLLLTMGDVAGIGPEVIARAWPALQGFCRPVVVGD